MAEPRDLVNQEPPIGSQEENPTGEREKSRPCTNRDSVQPIQESQKEFSGENKTKSAIWKETNCLRTCRTMGIS